jgi:integrase
MGRGHLVGPSAERVTFDDLKQLVVLDYKASGKSSLDRVERAFKQLEKFFGLYRAVDITKDRLLAYITSRQEVRHLRRGKLQPIQPATYKYELAMLKRAFSLAIEAEKLDHIPPFPGIEVHNTRERFFTEAQYESIQCRLPGEVRPLIEFLWLIGWRAHKEAKVLQWPQVDWTRGGLRLWNGTTKNKEPREIPFRKYPRLKSLLERQLAYTRKVERAKSMIIPWVFHRDGRPIKSFRKAWDRACTEAGLQGAWVHDFRRCVVRRFEDNHVKRGAAMAVTGHKTEAVYRRYNITTAKDVADAIEAIANYTEKPNLGKARAKQARRGAVR